MRIVSLLVALVFVAGIVGTCSASVELPKNWETDPSVLKIVMGDGDNGISIVAWMDGNQYKVFLMTIVDGKSDGVFLNTDKDGIIYIPL